MMKEIWKQALLKIMKEKSKGNLAQMRDKTRLLERRTSFLYIRKTFFGNLGHKVLEQREEQIEAAYEEALKRMASIDDANQVLQMAPHNKLKALSKVPTAY